MKWPFQSQPMVQDDVIYLRRPRPAPMPQVRDAILYLPDVVAALERGQLAWNHTQMLDAIQSAEHFLQAARRALKGGA
jgi:hypothetical protein